MKNFAAMLQNPDANSFFADPNAAQTKPEALASSSAVAGKLGSLTANLATSLGNIGQQLKPYVANSKPATAAPAQGVSGNVGE